MSTTISPPPQTPPVDAGRPAEAPRPPSGGARAVAIVVIVLGVLILAGATVSAAIGTAASAAVHTTSRTADAAGIDALRVDVEAGRMRVEFTDVSEAELEVTGASGADRWTLERDGDRLVVSSPNDFRWFGWGGWFGDRGADAVLRLPQGLDGLDAELWLSAGELSTAGGDFGTLDVTLNAGELDVSGSARTVSADVNAGKGTLELDDVESATVTVNAGSFDARFAGSNPDEVEAEVSAGSLRLTVPEGDYDVTSEVSAGGFDNRIGSTPGAASTIRVQVSAGEAVLTSDR